MPNISFAFPSEPTDKALALRIDKPNVSIIVPAFNEARRLAESAERLGRAVESGSIDRSTTEFIVVDDGSSDETGLVSHRLLSPVFPRLRVLRLHTNSGKGAAIRAGAAVATAPIVAFMDADMAVDPAQLPRLLTALDGAEVAVGSRRMEMSVVVSDSHRRSVMGRTFSYLVNSLTNVAIKDTQCGFKAFRSATARILFHGMAISGFAFDAEVLYLARRLGMRIAEVPVHWRDETGSTVRPIADPAFMAYDVLRMRAGKRGSHIPALTITARCIEHQPRSGGLPTCVLEAIGVNVPIVPLPNGGAFVLFPLSEPGESQQTALRLGQLGPKVRVSERQVALAELMKISPFVLLAGHWIDNGRSENHNPSLSNQRFHTPALVPKSPADEDTPPKSTLFQGTDGCG